VSDYAADLDKAADSAVAGTPLRNVVMAAAKAGTPDRLTYEHIVSALHDGDPVVKRVLAEAADYIGLALHTLITIANPSLILLGGPLLEMSETFLNMITAEARRLSWGAAWARTVIRPAILGQRAQVTGASVIAAQRLGW
jgi:glucokinase